MSNYSITVPVDANVKGDPIVIVDHLHAKKAQLADLKAQRQYIINPLLEEVLAGGWTCAVRSKKERLLITTLYFRKVNKSVPSVYWEGGPCGGLGLCRHRLNHTHYTIWFLKHMRVMGKVW